MTTLARRRLAVLVVVPVAVLPALASGSSATPPLRVQEAYFKVKVEGLQKTTWAADHEPANRCDPSYRGSGRERVTFRSRRAVVIRAFQIGSRSGRAPVTFVHEGEQADLLTRGSVTRSGTLTLDPPQPGCAVGDGGDGTSTPPAKDCGTKQIRSLSLRLAYDALKPDRITLSKANQDRKPEFTNCPLNGEGWPTILSRDDRNRTAGEELPRADLFDRRQGKMIVIGRGTVRGDSSGVRHTTTIEWDLTLTRIRR
jgi:hypothetical protein